MKGMPTEISFWNKDRYVVVSGFTFGSVNPNADCMLSESEQICESHFRALWSPFIHCLALSEYDSLCKLLNTK